MTLARPMFPPRADTLPKPSQIDRRGLVCGMAAVSASTAMASAALLASAAAARDPILAAIEAHVFAVARFEKTFAYGEGEGDEPEHTYAGAEADEAAWAMLQVEPTTVDGVWALLTYFSQSSETDQQFFPEVFDGEVNFPAALARQAANALSRMIPEGVR